MRKKRFVRFGNNIINAKEIVYIGMSFDKDTEEYSIIIQIKNTTNTIVIKNHNNKDEFLKACNELLNKLNRWVL